LIHDSHRVFTTFDTKKNKKKKKKKKKKNFKIEIIDINTAANLNINLTEEVYRETALRNIQIIIKNFFEIK